MIPIVNVWTSLFFVMKHSSMGRSYWSHPCWRGRHQDQLQIWRIHNIHFLFFLFMHLSTCHIEMKNWRDVEVHVCIYTKIWSYTSQKLISSNPNHTAMTMNCFGNIIWEWRECPEMKLNLNVAKKNKRKTTSDTSWKWCVVHFWEAHTS